MTCDGASAPTGRRLGRGRQPRAAGPSCGAQPPSAGRGQRPHDPHQLLTSSSPASPGTSSRLPRLARGLALPAQTLISSSFTSGASRPSSPLGTSPPALEKGEEPPSSHLQTMLWPPRGRSREPCHPSEGGKGERGGC